jgi:hypothetical protein
MIYYIVNYNNEQYTGTKIELNLIASPNISLFDLNLIYADFEETPTYNDLQTLESTGRCLIKSDLDSKNLIFFVDPLHTKSKQLIREILITKIIKKR